MSEKLRRAIAEAVKEAFDGYERDSSCRECCKDCDLDPKEHAQHHELLKGAFSLRSRIFNAAVTAMVGGGLVWLGLAVWEKIVRQVKG